MAFEQILQRMQRLSQRVNTDLPARVDLEMRRVAAQVTVDMRREARWNDNTGEARRTLEARTERTSERTWDLVIGRSDWSSGQRGQWNYFTLLEVLRPGQGYMGSWRYNFSLLEPTRRRWQQEFPGVVRSIMADVFRE